MSNVKFHFERHFYFKIWSKTFLPRNLLRKKKWLRRKMHHRVKSKWDIMKTFLFLFSNDKKKKRKESNDEFHWNVSKDFLMSIFNWSNEWRRYEVQSSSLTSMPLRNAVRREKEIKETNQWRSDTFRMRRRTFFFFNINRMRKESSCISFSTRITLSSWDFEKFFVNWRKNTWKKKFIMFKNRSKFLHRKKRSKIRFSKVLIETLRRKTNKNSSKKNEFSSF